MKMRVPGIKVDATGGLDKFYRFEKNKEIVFLVIFIPLLIFLLLLFIGAMGIGTTAPTGLNLPDTPKVFRFIWRQESALEAFTTNIIPPAH